MIQTPIPNTNKRLWKLKSPLKLKIFLWYPRRGVLLTKDNLIKRKWQGNKNCCFCHEDETIQHLYIDCRFALSVWSVAHIALNLAKPQSISHMFGSWLYGVKKELRSLVLLGAGVITWSIWLHKNDIVF